VPQCLPLGGRPYKSTPPISTPGWPRFWPPIRSQRA
jgi:hypothetical protein